MQAHSGLAGASLGNSDKVASFEAKRDGLFLNWSGRDEGELIENVVQLGRKSQSAKALGS